MSFSLEFAMLSVESRAAATAARIPAVTGERDAGFKMKSFGVRRENLAVVAVVLALLAAGGALAFAVSAGASPQSAQQETTVPSPTDTGPSPDPAPAPKPAPKPATTTHRTYTPPPKSTYSAPTRTYSTPTYTSPGATVTHTSKPKVIKKQKVVVHKKKPPAAKPAVTTSTPADTTPVPALLVPVGARQTRSSGSGDHAVTSVLFIAGVTFAGLLFLLAAAVPGTPVRFTPVGRIVFEHQQDLVLVGLAAFIITVFVYLLTGHGL
jgi:cytoskeletal protein RodZ